LTDKQWTTLGFQVWQDGDYSLEEHGMIWEARRSRSFGLLGLPKAMETLGLMHTYMGYLMNLALFMLCTGIALKGISYGWNLDHSFPLWNLLFLRSYVMNSDVSIFRSNKISYS
jgi:hypothetical protein